MPENPPMREAEIADSARGELATDVAAKTRTGEHPGSRNPHG